MKVGIKQLYITKQQLQTIETELPILYGSIQLVAKMSKPTSENIHQVSKKAPRDHKLHKIFNGNILN